MENVYIGVMTGTSMDGVDVVAATFEPFELHATYSVAFDDELRDELMALSVPGDNEIERMGTVDVALGHLIGQAVNTMIEQYQLPHASIIAIGSHGQTIRHRPASGFTLQIGDPNVIHELTHIPVVADFRRRDMAAGGQGAPLVPGFHEAIFKAHISQPNIPQVVVNIGGMANVSVLSTTLHALYGFDTGPGNVLMDAWCLRHTGFRYDDSGHWGATGIHHDELLNQLLEHPYFALPAPKSTGRETFNIEWLDMQLADFPDLLPEDVQATLLQLTTRTIADAIHNTGATTGEVWVCGGGAYNDVLMAALQNILNTWVVQSSAVIGLSPQWVEAAAFAWLTKQRIDKTPANAPSVTGAKGPRILGGIW